MKKLSYYLSVALVCFACSSNDLEKNFKNPPSTAKPRIWWHWMNGNVSKEGITKDLHAMSDVGIGGCTIFSIDLNCPKGEYTFYTPEWMDLMNHAIKTADTLGLELTFHNCDGWATSGGPWVTPDNAMKKTTFSRIHITGGAAISETLPMPDTIKGYYHDLAVFAYPEHQNKYAMQEASPKITSDIKNAGFSNLTDGDLLTTNTFYKKMEYHGGAGYIDFTFDKPFKASRILIASDYNTYPKTVVLQTSRDGKKYKTVDTIKIKFSGITRAFPEQNSKYYRLVLHKFNDPAYWFNRFELGEILLMQKGERGPESPIRDWPEKTGLWHVGDDWHIFGKSDANLNYLSIAKDKITDLSKNMDSTGKINWDAPKGEWTIVRIGYTLTGAVCGPATKEGQGLECDKLSENGIRNSFGGYAKSLIDANKKYVGKTLNLVLIDSYESGPQNWTQNLPEEFLKRRGYDLHPWLTALTGISVGSIDETERFLWDYRRTLSDLFAEKFLGEMRKICKENNVLFNGEAANSWGTPLCDAINYEKETDVPMNEFWTQSDPMENTIGEDGTFKDAVSTAHIYSKPVIACEAFTSGSGHWRHHPQGLKPQGDSVFTMGINRITFHMYAHQSDERIPGWQMKPFGMGYNRKLTWWNELKPWHEYITRCQYMLQQGTCVADVLVFTGEGTPATVMKTYHKDPYKLLPEGYNYDACNSETILKRCKVKNGKIVLENGLSYSLLIMPTDRAMTLEMAERIKELVEDGANVYSQKPTHVPGLFDHDSADKKVQEIVKLVWADCNGLAVREHAFGKGKMIYGKSYARTLFDLGIQKDFSYWSKSKGLTMPYIHRQYKGTDIYFISNQKNAPALVQCTFRIKHKIPELWNAEDGSITTAASYDITDSTVSLPIQFDQHGSVFVVFRKKTNESVVDSVKKRTRSVVTAIKGPWNVAFTPGWNAPESIVFDELIAWNEHKDQNIRYYSGTAVYTKEFEITKDMMGDTLAVKLDLGNVKEIAVVSLNGSDPVILWKAPFSADITKSVREGKNQLEIKVINSWANFIIGDLNQPKDKRRMWSNNDEMYKKDDNLFESGLIGPVTIQAKKK